MRMLAVAHNTFREAVRDKVLYVLLFFAATTVLGSKALGWVSIGQDIKIVKDISLASISVFGSLIAIFVGTNLVYKEIDKRTIYTIISRPMDRYEFILGKYLGLMWLIGVVTFLMMSVASVYLMILGGTLDGPFFFAVLLIYWKISLITALSVLLSSLTSPILGALIVVSFYILGHATRIFLDLPDQIQGWSRTAMEIVYYIIPNLSNFDLNLSIPVRPAFVLWSLAYGAIYTAVLLFLAAVAFENKDL